MHRMSDKTIFIVTVEKERETAKAISSLPFQKAIRLMCIHINSNCSNVLNWSVESLNNIFVDLQVWYLTQMFRR